VSRVRSIALALWELPQNVLGAANLAMQLATRNVARLGIERERLFVELRGDGAISLGWFVFWSDKPNPWIKVSAKTKWHEWGHTFQSRALGPLYLPLVGVPSTMRVMYALGHYKLTGRRWTGYYRGWPEKQADRLGGVDSEA
jgi:hypothetical protein